MQPHVFIKDVLCQDPWHIARKKTTWLSSFPFPPKRNMALFPETTHISRRTFVCFLDNHPSNLNGTEPTDPVQLQSSGFCRGPFGPERFFHRWRFPWKPENKHRRRMHHLNVMMQEQGLLTLVKYGKMLFCLLFLPPKNNRWLALADAGGRTFFF